MNCCNSNTCKNEFNKLCPICSEKAQPVKNITIKNMVIENELNRVGEQDYYICLNTKCEVVYFNAEANTFNQQQVKVPIWYKEGANPKYACYCSKVTEEDIIDAVVNQGARNMKAVTEVTGAMKQGKCLTNNPIGKCCHQEVQKVIDKAIKTVNL
jgi:bacterioferritin-associated ferredoxin